MVHERTIDLVKALTGDPPRRREAARALAADIGAGDLIILVRDPELDVYLPAAGFPQTLPGGGLWQSFSRKCAAAGYAETRLEYPDSGALRVVRAWCGEGIILAALDGDVKADSVTGLRLLTPFLSQIFSAERAALTAAGQTRAALESAAQARQLADALDSARRELQSALNLQSRHLAQRELAEAELARSNADLQRFAYSAAHDLQEPLRTITSYAQLLSRRQGDMNPEARQWIEFITGGTLRMQQLIEALLGYAHASAGPAESEPVCAEELLRTVEMNLNTQLLETGATLTRDPLPVVQGDPVQLAQLFQNLVSNSLKYRGADPPRIHVSADVRGNEAVFSFRDNGMGIPPKYHEQIFDMFKRLHGRQYPGAGLGLSSCRRIVERYGGRIWVESDLGKGSAFFFTVPLAVAQPGAEAATP